MMVLFPNCSKVGDNTLYLFFSRTLLSCCLSYCSQPTSFQNRPSCSVSAVTFHCSWTYSWAQKHRGPGKSSFLGLANISCMHSTFMARSSVGGKWKNLWKFAEFLLLFCLQITPSPSPPWETANPYVGNQWKSTAKHYPWIHSAGKAFRQPPFCLTILIFHQTLHTMLLLLLLLLFIIICVAFRI